MKKYTFCLILASALLALGPIATVKAADFDPSYILSDSEMVDYNSMDLNTIQKFLNNKKGTLSNYLTQDKEGNTKTAAQTFYEVAQRWLINPKYLLLLVQKEQSLLTDNSPTPRQYDRATGYGCPDSGGCDDRFKGFYRQVNSAAAQTRYYLDNMHEFTYRPEATFNIDNQQVFIKNKATACLYNYTPHIHGNKNLWDMWNDYFSRKWPDGTLLRPDDNSQVYLIQNGKRREIISKAVLVSRFDPKKIIDIPQSELDLYENSVPIKYLNYSLLQDNNGDIYMVIDDMKRKFETSTLLKKFGFGSDDIIKASASELTQYTDGNNISEYSFYPTGVIAQDAKTKAIFYVQSGGKKPIINEEILKANFAGQPIKKMPSEELDKYPTNAPISLPDGWLVKTKNNSAVYVVSNGKILPFLNSAAFYKLKYSFKNVKVVSEQTLAAHVLGQGIAGDW